MEGRMAEQHRISQGMRPSRRLPATGGVRPETARTIIEERHVSIIVRRRRCFVAWARRLGRGMGGRREPADYTAYRSPLLIKSEIDGRYGMSPRTARGWPAEGTTGWAAPA